MTDMSDERLNELLAKATPGPDYGTQTRATHPNGEGIWRLWCDNQLYLCAQIAELCRAAPQSTAPIETLAKHGGNK